VNHFWGSIEINIDCVNITGLQDFVDLCGILGSQDLLHKLWILTKDLGNGSQYLKVLLWLPEWTVMQ
jgi:hypothetical protein